METSSKLDRVSDDASTNVNISRPFNVDCYENKCFERQREDLDITTP